MLPVIKWTGSKRSQAKQIVGEFPREIDTYYEPFIGGASVLAELLNSEIKAKRYVCSDINGDLIKLWMEIKKNPLNVASYYEELWLAMDSNDSIVFKKEFFNSVRERFNREKSPLDFMFIMRTAVNGMPRYNKRGEFNTSFHLTRKGINPKNLCKIIKKWSELLNYNDVEFLCTDYLTIQAEKGDILYLDPPYANTAGIYFGGINHEELWSWLRKQNGKFFLSYNGISGNINKTQDVPKDLYSDHKYLRSGLSRFKKVIQKGEDCMVYESLYIGN